MNKIIQWVLVVAAFILSLFSISTSKVPAQIKSIGGTVHNVQETFDSGIAVNGTEVISSSRGLSAASIAVGSGTSVTKLLKGTCNLIGTPTISATSTSAMDCAVSGVVAGDTVFMQTPTTTPATFEGWNILGANASSTSGYLTVILQNLTGANAVPPATVTGSLQYLILR